MLVIVNLNSFEAQETTIRLDMPALGMDWFDRFAVYDEVSKQTFNWGSDNYVKLEPWDNVAHILVLPDIPEERRADLCFRETNTD